MDHPIASSSSSSFILNVPPPSRTTLPPNRPHGKGTSTDGDFKFLVVHDEEMDDEDDHHEFMYRAALANADRVPLLSEEEARASNSPPSKYNKHSRNSSSSSCSSQSQDDIERGRGSARDRTRSTGRVDELDSLSPDINRTGEGRFITTPANPFSISDFFDRVRCRLRIILLSSSPALSLSPSPSRSRSPARPISTAGGSHRGGGRGNRRRFSSYLFPTSVASSLSSGLGAGGNTFILSNNGKSAKATYIRQVIRLFLVLVLFTIITFFGVMYCLRGVSDAVRFGEKGSQLVFKPSPVEVEDQVEPFPEWYYRIPGDSSPPSPTHQDPMSDLVTSLVSRPNLPTSTPTSDLMTELSNSEVKKKASVAERRLNKSRRSMREGDTSSPSTSPSLSNTASASSLPPNRLTNRTLSSGGRTPVPPVWVAQKLWERYTDRGTILQPVLGGNLHYQPIPPITCENPNPNTYPHENDRNRGWRSPEEETRVREERDRALWNIEKRYGYLRSATHYRKLSRLDEKVEEEEGGHEREREEVDEHGNRMITGKGRIFIGINLFNAERVIPTLTTSLLQLIEFLDPAPVPSPSSNSSEEKNREQPRRTSRVSISIFENGSSDRTVPLMAHFSAALTALGVEHSVRSDRQVTPGWTQVDRIQQLAVYRNIALEPMYWGSDEGSRMEQQLNDANVDDQTSSPSSSASSQTQLSSGQEPFETVLFINDAYHCATDILELLHQRVLQQASATCGLDWIGRKDHFRFYDAWVTRSLTGNTIRPRLDLSAMYNGVQELFTNKGEEDYKMRYRAGLSVPVYSCWNGMIAFDARPFRGEIIDLPPSPSHSDLEPTLVASSSLIAGSLPTTSSAPNRERQEAEMFGFLKQTSQGEAEEQEAGENDPDGKHDREHYRGIPVQFRSSDWRNGECEASESKIVAKDFWRRGFTRFVLVPTVNVVYDAQLYGDRTLKAMSDSRYTSSSPSPSISPYQKLSKTKTESGLVQVLQEKIDWNHWSRIPEKVICWPWTTKPHVDFAWLRARWEDPM